MNFPDQQSQHVICLLGITRSYPAGTTLHTILNNVSLSVPAGQSCAIVGTSGSGKSTLLNIIGLLDKPTSGQVFLAGEDMSLVSEDARAKVRNQIIGFVFQGFNLLPRLNALDGFTGCVLEGHIAAISVQSNASDSYGGGARYDVVAAIDTLPSDSAQQIRLGMSARVVVILYRNEKAIVVPPQAIHGEGDIAWVWYRKTLDTETIKQHVKIGNTVSQGVEILGIQAGYVMIP